jgi:hypothetical protein
MRAKQYAVLIAVFAVALGSGVASAETINVAEFRWSTITNPDALCDDPLSDPGCLLSVFQLANIWDGDEPGVTLFDNTLTLAADPEETLEWFDLEPPGGADFDQLPHFPALGLATPLSATASVSFMFGGELITLAGTLTEPGTPDIPSFTILRFTPPDIAAIPEPGTLGLVALGAAVMARRRRRTGGLGRLD